MTTVTGPIGTPTHLNPREADPKRWAALAVIAVAQLMVVLDASIVTIALPSAQKSLHISTDNRQWMVTAYTLAFGGLLLLGGRIADYVGRKRMFIIGLLGFASASALGGAAVNAPMLFGARALQGAMAAMLAPAALSLITVTFTEVKERATAFGVYGAIAGGGAAIGLIMGGVLTQYASWRWCLYVNVPIAIVTALVAVPIVRESRAHGNTSYDVPGAVTVTAGLVSLVYGFTQAAQNSWTAVSTLSYLGAAVVLLMGTKASPMPMLMRISAGSTWALKLVWAPIWVSHSMPSAAAVNPPTITGLGPVRGMIFDEAPAARMMPAEKGRKANPVFSAEYPRFSWK